MLLSVLATPSEPVAVPAGFADRVVEAMKAERHARIRYRSYVGSIGAIAATLLLAVGLTWYFKSPRTEGPDPRLPGVHLAERPEVAPAPREKTPAPEAAPEPRVVVAVGACGCSGGIFGEGTYAAIGGVDRVLPVDVYIPGCPPRPQAILNGLLVAMGVREARVPSNI